MKNIVFLLCFIFLSIPTVFAQSFSGMAVYESKTSTADMMANMQGNREIPPDRMKMIEDRMKKAFEKTFILTFDRNASTYKEEEKLDGPGDSGGGMRMFSSMMGGGGTHYKNIKDKSFIVDKEFFGKEFLIKDSLTSIPWKLEGESKQIGNYTCFKATAIVPVVQSDFRNFRRRDEEASKNEKTKDSTKQKKEDSSTNFMDQWELPKDKVITAWYTPDIPVPHGPDEYWGLPGLILEVSDGKTIMLCSKIVLNPKDKKEIKAPKNGKVVTQKEYDAIVTEKTKEMQEMGRGGGRGFQMRMGG
ncbi:MAG: GLPGLI family protein [Flavobacterium sp.]